MMQLLGTNLHELLDAYGISIVFIIVGLESMGLPLPGETLLVGAAVYSGTTHRIDILSVVAAAACGAFVGDNLGYWIGRRFGVAALRRYGGSIGLHEERLKLGQYLFRRHGGKVVFFGRFAALLRTLAALLAGANRMPWKRFVVFNLLGGLIWASVFGFGGYVLGDTVQRIAGPAGLLLSICGICAILIGILAIRRAEGMLRSKASAEEPPFEGPQERPASR